MASLDIRKVRTGLYSCLGNIDWLHRDLMIGSHQIDFEKDCESLKGGCEVLYMWNWILIGLGDVV